MIDRVQFFARSGLSGLEADGCNVIFDGWDRRPELTDVRWLAYMLGTTKWETDSTMQPVREAYWLSEEWRRENLRYYPFYGRGFVQLTWERNYQNMTELLHLSTDLVAHPDDALDPDIAVRVMFEGMLKGSSSIGDFTGRSLEEFFGPSIADWIGARTIINGIDHAADIANIAKGFWHALGGPRTRTVLQYGDKGAEVIELQVGLNSRSFSVGKADGDFGPATKGAVINFQSANLLGVDGIVGDETWKALGLS